MEIIKRNGNIVPFDINKIINAVNKAIKETTGIENNQLATTVANIVTAQCKNKIEVEEIQDLVIKTLLGLGETDIATHYISYRATQTYKRNMALEKLYNRMGEIVKFGDNENSNKNYKLPSVVRDTIAGEYFRENIYKVLPKELAEAHKTKAIHWHDADMDTKLTNCFTRDTEFITDKGVQSFLDFNHNDKVRVLTHNGQYKNAIVKHYGKQLINEVTFKRGKLEYKVKCTKNHRWILNNENVTTNLKIGDKLIHTKEYFDLFDIKKATKRQKELWCRGFILGDGNVSIIDGREYTRVRICGHKKELSCIFEECGYKINKNNYTKKDYLINNPGNLKQIPYEMLNTEDDIIAYISGFLYADGGIGLNPNGTTYRSIYAKEKEVQEFIQKYFPAAGVYISKINDLTNKPSNFTRNGNPKEYILLTKIPNTRTYKTKVVDIKENVDLEEVWCLEVEDDHSFVFPNGICTGNCCLFNIEDMLANGTRVNNADIESPKSVDVAMNIGSQIMASISASQYGK